MRNIVETFTVNDNEACVITKGSSKTMVFSTNNFVAAVSMTHTCDGEPLIMLVKCATPSLEEYRHVMAKLVCKNSDSKYFDNPLYNEHFNNGNGVAVINKNDVLHIYHTCERVYKTSESKELWALYPVEDNDDYAGVITALSPDATAADMMIQHRDAIFSHDDEGKMVLVDRKMIIDTGEDQDEQRFMGLTIKNQSIVWDSLRNIEPSPEIIKNADAMFKLYVETQAMFENEDLTLTTEDLNFGDFDHSIEQ